MIHRFLRASLFALAALIATAASAKDEVQADTFYVDYSARPNPTHLLAHELCILHGDAEADLDAGHRLGNRYLAYLSLVEVADSAEYRKAVSAAGVASLVTNETWKSAAVDVANPAWRRFVIEKLAQPAAERGFDGFFLDTVDSLRLLTGNYPDKADALRDGLLTLIRELQSTFPDKSLVINRGFELLPDLAPEIIDAVLIESVCRSFDPATGNYISVDPAHTRTLTDQIAQLKEDGYPVYVVDYAKPGEQETIAETTRLIRALDAAPFITTPELNGTISAGGEVARRILVLFGHDPKEVERHRIWPADTTTHAIIQMPLEYMGYEVDYHDVSQGIPTLGTGTEYAGIILDEELELPFSMEHDYANWLLARLDEKKKLLFLGSYAFSDHYERDRIFARLGIMGDDEVPIPAGTPKIATLDETIMNFESPVMPTRRDFSNHTAPEGSRILLSIEANTAADDSGQVARYDAVYLSSWGGALLSPFLVFEASEETLLQFADPFKLLNEIWPANTFPAPDPTTRDGLRVFYTHVDGDGFSSLSAVDPGKTCAEVLYDRLLKDLPWPITISVVEAEIRGQMLSQAKGESETLTEIARRIYELPNVEPASHSYSHPYLWIGDDAEFDGLYDSRNLDLKLTAKYPSIDLKRETVDSLAYITENLTPADRPAELLLWSGNCRPSPEALRHLRAQGYENMNGGNTILCRRFPGLFGVAPRTISWNGELQINAANQNEFMYTDGWNGPTWGGFAQVIETFEMTETPRRLKPVNVYYHFYSAERLDAFAALNKIYDWCRGQELHAVTGLDFARLTRDSWQTKIVRTGERRWVAVNDGLLRTFRLPANLGTPDLFASKGVTGYHQDGDNLYVHTDGRPRVTLELSDSPSVLPHLETSTAEVRIERLATDAMDLRVLSRPAAIVVGGFAPESRIEVTMRDQSETLETDANGRLQLETPAAVSLTLRLAPR